MAKVINLPSEAYTDQAWFEREQAELFSKTWQFAGFVEDVANAGDYITVQAGLNNILVVKGRDQRLRAFHNLCRHRGTQLLRVSGKAQKSLTCPYHDWTYSLNGELLSVPEEKQEFPNLDKKKLCLHRARVETWLGMIWVHPDPEAQSLLHWMGDAQYHIGPHNPEELIEYEEGATEHTIKANWKIVVENYIDGYHLSHLHSSTLDMYDHQKQKTGFIGPHFMFYEPLAEEYAKNVMGMSDMPVLDCFTDEQPMGAYVPMLFPNLGIGAAENSWSTFHVIPVAPDETIVRTRTRVKQASDWEFTKQSMKAATYYKSTYGVKYPDSQDKNDPMNSGDFMAEDVFACEQQQRSLKSPYFSVGATAQYQEASVRGFQEQVIKFLKK